ncbi:Hypothetical predicted protein [Olea europaea subsp. europaea]|uniref:Uncharacterized protein n=1 Tax=Olea europaea subsp. europaea TaxID=158383 RepID=A0A8S0T8A1_OLEEU|nr:Hypothetical predicted protein [Olea europaea subsp. europaea]
MSEMCPDRDRDAARFSRFSWQFLGHGEQVMSSTLPNFQKFQGSFWDTVRRPCSGCVWAKAVYGARCASHARDSFGPRQGRDVQAMSRTRQGCNLIFRHFWAVSETWCAGLVWDAFEPWQGPSLIFMHFWAVFGHNVQVMFATCPGRGKDLA